MTDDLEYDPRRLFGGDRGAIRGASKNYIFQLRGEPSCTKECPAGVNIKAYVSLIANRRFEEAVDVIRRANPFPIVCGRVCTRPCEAGCEQGEDGDPVQIRGLKRYASDFELARREIDSEPCDVIYEERVAIIGSGPAGLTAAVDLARLGYPVTVFESAPEPGGMLRYAIPSFRLPKRVLKREIDWIRDLGVEILTGHPVDEPARLLEEGYSAILIATGASVSFELDIEGEDGEGVIDSLDLLRQVNIDPDHKIKGDVIVIGGGSTAFDAARTAVRIGAGKVTIVYRRTEEEMPAQPEELEEAREEGIEMVTLAMPNRIVLKKGKVVGMEFLRAALGEPDDSGRRRPVPMIGSEFVIDADIIVPAISNKPDPDFMEVVRNECGEELVTERGRLGVMKGGCTAVEGIFGAGDVEQGPSSVVISIGRGHEAASGIHDHLRSKGLEGGLEGKKEWRTELLDSPLVPVISEPLAASGSDFEPDLECAEVRACTFDEVERTMSGSMAVGEASRCLTCGPCDLCDTCVPTCDHKQVAATVNGEDLLLKVPSALSHEVENGLDRMQLVTESEIRTFELASLTATIDPAKCVGCGRCEEVCGYRAIGSDLRRGESPRMNIDHDACASCSACVPTCPAGAISQGYMSDQAIFDRISSTMTEYGIAVLPVHWLTGDPRFGSIPGTVEVMSERRFGPMFIIRSLARAGRGLLLIGPDMEVGSHYLVRGETVERSLEGARRLLRAVGASGDRVRYVQTAPGDDVGYVMDQALMEMRGASMEPLPGPIPLDTEVPLLETLDILAALEMGRTDGGRCAVQDLISLLGEVTGLYDIQETIASLEIVAKMVGTDERNPALVIDSAMKGMDDLQLGQLKMKVGVRALRGFNGKSLRDRSVDLVRAIPGIEVVDLRTGEEGSEPRTIDSEAGQRARDILARSVEQGLDAIVCGDPADQAFLDLVNRKGGWRTADIEILSPFELLVRSMMEVGE